MIELASTVLLLASVFSPEKAVAETTSVTPIVLTKEETAASEHPVTLSEYVTRYFKDTPILAKIAQCESEMRQYDEKGNLLRGRVNDADVGIMQINTYYHGRKAHELGYDLRTVDGNLGFAQWLYDKYGDDPWVHSSKCWKSAKVAVR
jgi:hypothetical protein